MPASQRKRISAGSQNSSLIRRTRLSGIFWQADKLSSFATANNLRAIAEAWSGYNEQARDVVIDGMRTQYVQVTEPSLSGLAISVGFRSQGWPVANQVTWPMYTFTVSKVSVLSNGQHCIFSCKNGDHCLLDNSFPRKLYQSVSLLAVRPGSCQAIAAAIEQATPEIEAQLAAEQAEKDRRLQQQQQAQAAAQKEAQDLIDHRKSALADCGQSPKVSRGPWLSSTYSIGALKNATELVQAGEYICSKSITYIGPDVNPFGGSAAKANFAGYDRAGHPYTRNATFPY
jgi:hypothetical protein